MAKKRVLHLASWYPNRLDITLGIFTRRHIASALPYHDPVVVHIVPDPDLKEEYQLIHNDYEGIEELIVYYRPIKHNIPVLSSWMKMNRYMGAMDVAMEHINEPETFDLIHVHVVYRAGLLGKKWSEELKIPMVITEHWTGYHEDSIHYDGYFKKRLISESVAATSCIMPVTEHLAESMQYRGLKGNYTVVPNVVDTDFFKPAEDTRIPNKILVVAALDDEQKNIKGTLKVFDRLWQEQSDYQITIAGDGPDRTSLEGFASKLDSSASINFTGNLKPEDVREHMRNSSLLVLFSNFENQPCVLIEAMACGLQVCATDVGGVREMIPENCGVVIQKLDENELFSSVNKLMAQPLDPNPLVEHAQNYNVASVGAQINSVYEKVIAERVN